MTTTRDPFPPEVPLSELTGDQLRARTARASMFLIELESAGTSTPDEQAAARRDAYLSKLESEGRLYGFGPVDAGQPGPVHELAIVAAASRDEAASIAAHDPFVAAGLRTYTVRGHTMNEGVACYVGRSMAQRVQALSAPFDPAVGEGASSPAYDAVHADGARLFLIPLEPTDKPRPAEDTQSMHDHFVWLRENEMKAALMSCGPVEATRQLSPGVWGGGLGVVATSREVAERIAAAEPSGRMGYRALSVHSWTMSYGLAAPIAKALEGLNSLPR